MSIRASIFRAQVEEIAEEYPVGMAWVVQKLGPVPVPRDDESDEFVQELLDNLRRVCAIVEMAAS